jgi:hypothetical protein
MHISKPILLSLIGLALGGAAAVMVGHTGLRRAMAEPPAGKTSPRAPAATCDCPPAEPPLAGRFEEVRALQYIAPKGTGVKDVTCPAGAYLISGSCSTDYDTVVYKVALRESRHIGSPPNGWHCSWANNEPMLGLNFRVAAICLKPAP